jgi:hypothetical protein
MELLLNLIWLTLALPAFWLWRRQAVHAESGCRFGRVRPLWLCGCVLMLLFPVVSATDDLQASRQEMEESSPSQRMVKQSACDKSSKGLSHAGALPALIPSASFCVDSEACGQISLSPVLVLHKAQIIKRPSRAPPLSSPDTSTGFSV